MLTHVYRMIWCQPRRGKTHEAAVPNRSPVDLRPSLCGGERRSRRPQSHRQLLNRLHGGERPALRSAPWLGAQLLDGVVAGFVIGSPWPEVRTVRRASHSGVPGAGSYLAEYSMRWRNQAPVTCRRRTGPKVWTGGGEEDVPAAVGGYVLVGQGLTLCGELRRAVSRRQTGLANRHRTGRPENLPARAAH